MFNFEIATISMLALLACSSGKAAEKKSGRTLGGPASDAMVSRVDIDTATPVQDTAPARVQDAAPAKTFPDASATSAAPVAPLPKMVRVEGPPRFLEPSSVWRQSPNYKPPWSKVEIPDAYFYFKPKVGAEVSILPACDKPHFRLQIVSVEIDIVEDVKRWATRFSPIQDPAYLESSDTYGPCKMLVVYPAQDELSVVESKNLKKGWLPSRLTPAHVQWAVDNNKDGKPDVLLATYCTDDRKEVECYEATATVIYQKRGKQWRKLYTWEPLS